LTERFYSFLSVIETGEKVSIGNLLDMALNQLKNDHTAKQDKRKIKKRGKRKITTHGKPEQKTEEKNKK